MAADTPIFHINEWEDLAKVKESNPKLRHATFHLVELSFSDIITFLASLGLESKECQPDKQDLDFRFILDEIAIYITDDSLAILTSQPQWIEETKEYFDFSSLIEDINRLIPIHHLQLPLNNARFIPSLKLECLTSIIFTYDTPLLDEISSIVKIIDQQTHIVDYNLAIDQSFDQWEADVKQANQALVDALINEGVTTDHINSFFPLLLESIAFTPNEAIARVWDFDLYSYPDTNLDAELSDFGLVEVIITAPDKYKLIAAKFDDPSKVMLVLSSFKEQ